MVDILIALGQQFTNPETEGDGMSYWSAPVAG